MKRARYRDTGGEMPACFVESMAKHLREVGILHEMGEEGPLKNEQRKTQ